MITGILQSIRFLAFYCEMTLPVVESIPVGLYFLVFCEFVSRNDISESFEKFT